MKKIFTIFITVVILITTICLSVGAVSHNNGGSGSGRYLPIIGYTVEAETDGSNIIFYESPVFSTTDQSEFIGKSSYDGDSLYELRNIQYVNNGLTLVTDQDSVYKTTMEYIIPDWDDDNDAEILGSGFRVSYYPFSTKYTAFLDATDFSDIKPYFGNVVGTFGWDGANAGTTNVRMYSEIRAYYPEVVNSTDSGTTVEVRQNLIRLEYNGSVDAFLFNPSNIPQDDIAIYNVSTSSSMTWSDFTALLRRGHTNFEDDVPWFDVEKLEFDFTFMQGHSSSLYIVNTKYVTEGFYSDSNSLFIGQETLEDVGYRQQNYGSYITLLTALQRQRSEYITLWNETQGGTIVDGVGDRLGNMVGIFTKTVGAVLDVDLFGFGITLGDITFVMILALVVVIFLRLFAGG